MALCDVCKGWSEVEELEVIVACRPCLGRGIARAYAPVVSDPQKQILALEAAVAAFECASQSEAGTGLAQDEEHG
jgi:hypothetical protein